jgi:hypothetical protein
MKLLLFVIDVTATVSLFVKQSQPSIKVTS